MNFNVRGDLSMPSKLTSCVLFRSRWIGRKKTLSSHSMVGGNSDESKPNHKIQRRELGTRVEGSLDFVVSDMQDYTVSLQTTNNPRTMDFSGGLSDYPGLPIKYSVDVYECRLKKQDKALHKKYSAAEI